MFYRPNFCCHCGEKIARSRWTPLTSRRFCDFCEIEQKQHDLLPRVGAALALLIGAAGLTAYFGGDQRAARKETQESARTAVAGPRAALNTERKLPHLSNQAISLANSNAASAGAVNYNSALPKQLQMRSDSSTEPVYYCGALTKKGSPCTRRVKTKGSCWQHKGKSELD